MYFNKNTKYKRCTILLKDDIYKRLKTKGKFGESFSELICRLLDELDLLEKRIRLKVTTHDCSE
jgi:predicted CopG family antitoxin